MMRRLEIWDVQHAHYCNGLNPTQNFHVPLSLSLLQFLHKSMGSSLLLLLSLSFALVLSHKILLVLIPKLISAET